VGENFGAGMTGGMAFVYDPGERFELYLNADSVVIQRLASAHWEQALHGLVSEHAEETGSRFAKELLRDWDRVRGHFWQVCPKEMIKRLAHPLVDQEVKETA
jgi:glutamate synthase (NADPH/NADH) large chain